MQPHEEQSEVYKSRMFEQHPLGTWHPEPEPKHKGSGKLGTPHFLKKTKDKNKVHPWNSRDKTNCTLQDIIKCTAHTEMHNTHIAGKQGCNQAARKCSYDQARIIGMQRGTIGEISWKQGMHSRHPYQKVKSCVWRELRAYKRDWIQKEVTREMMRGVARGAWKKENLLNDTVEQWAVSKYSYLQKELCLIKGHSLLFLANTWLSSPSPF